MPPFNQLASVIAWPLSYFILNQWLQQFPYRKDIEFWIFLGTGLVTLGIAVLTMSYQSIGPLCPILQTH